MNEFRPTPSLRQIWGRRRLIGDGGMGTMVQAGRPTLEDYAGHDGCTEILNLTQPGLIESIHRAYLEAGSDIIGSNTFGANLTALGEYGLTDRLEELAEAGARLARTAADWASTAQRPRFVFGSMGPGTKLASLGQVSYADLRQGYLRQARALLAGGVDGFLIETCQDLLQAKAAVNAARQARRESGGDQLIVVDVTVETNGALLAGADIAAAWASLSGLGLDGVGLNCATGPAEMRPHLRQLAGLSQVPLVCMPNAGLPELGPDGAVYPLTPSELARALSDYADSFGLALVGGCCGTTPQHIRALAQAVADRPLTRPPVPPAPALSSAYSAVAMDQEVSYLAVGERANANGSKAFRQALLEERWEDAVAIGRDQVRQGAHVIDLSVDWVGRDAVADMAQLAGRFAQAVAAPIMVDSTDPRVIQTALERLPGRSVVNSVSFEEGSGPDSRYRRIVRQVVEHGAVVVALCIDQAGQARSAERKVAVAEALIDDLCRQHGLNLSDIVVDCLTFPIATGQDETRRDGLATIEAIRQLKRRWPGLHTVLGVSNVSFGLNPTARRVLNSVFLAECRAAGLDWAIVPPGRIMPLADLDDELRQAAQDLVHDRRRPGYDPLTRLLELSDRAGQAASPEQRASQRADWPVGRRLTARVLEGDSSGLTADLALALRERPAIDVINADLLEGMREVGRRFGAGQTQLPFVLRSAEVMKQAVDWLQPHLGGAEAHDRGTLVLATVLGDVHDIGKNLVDIIVSNNGYKVVNLGIKQPIAAIVAAAEEHRADAIGMSGLLVKSTEVMRDNLIELTQRGLAERYPVLLGGAALNRRFVEQDLGQLYGGQVRYAKDAFEGLRLMEQIMAAKGGGDDPEPVVTRPAVRLADRPSAAGPARSAVARPVPGSVEPPRPPFWGARVEQVDQLNQIAARLDSKALFAGQWGLKASPGGPSYQELVDQAGWPRLRRWLDQMGQAGWAEPAVVYGYWPVCSQGQELILFDPTAAQAGLAPERERVRFQFPRQSRDPWLCLADYFRDRSEAERFGPDLVGLQLVTMGPRLSQVTADLFAADHYRDYLELHGLSVQLAEALAELWHQRVRQELGLAGPGSSPAEPVPADRDAMAQRDPEPQSTGGVGCRYSFGYPACPDLAQRRILVRLLGADRIGVSLSEQDQLEPEQSTDALIVCHPEAHYFNAR
ncbi:MAG: methionine synthase [Propionibacteriaceae bacterium]|jgi:5-methyltetrahydrofolate--homocysteine methyltransferase|nr:methionine synthase [Propionibacteriaceae bacterium]